MERRGWFGRAVRGPGIGSVLLVTLAAVAGAQVPSGTPRRMNAEESMQLLGVGRPCPQGFTPITDDNVRSMGLTADQFWPAQAMTFQMTPPAQLRQMADQVTSTRGLSPIPDNDLAAQFRCQLGAYPVGQPAGPTPGAGGSSATEQAITSTAQALSGAAPGTPLGVAAAAAPLAIPAAKKVAGMFGKKPQTAETMAKDLAKGRLEVRDFRFAEGAADPAEGAEESLIKLADALRGVEGTFVLYVAAEAVGKAAPDLELQKSRLEQVWARLLAAGISEDRIRLDLDAARAALSEKARAPAQNGEARLIVLRAEP